MGPSARRSGMETASARCVGWNRHCEERSDEAIQGNVGALRSLGLLRFARNDDRGSTQMQIARAIVQQPRRLSDG